MKKYIYLLLINIIGTGLYSSCSDFLDSDPKTFLPVEKVYTSCDRVEPLVSGLYMSWRSQQKDRLYLLPMMGNDESAESEAQIVWESQQAGLDKYNGELNSRHSLLTQYWNQYWGVISSAAEIINGTQYIQDNVEKRDMLKAEACFIRAAQYFSLVQYWGDVPIIDYSRQIELGTKRQPIKEVWKLIIDDLSFATEHLPMTVEDKNRVTSGAAKALLGKAYLHADPSTGYRDYEKAAQLFKDVIDNHGYQLVDNYADLFDYTKANSTESIYEFQFSNISPNQNQIQYQLGSRACTHQGSYWGGYETILPTEYCVNIFEEGDQRFEASIRKEVLYNEAGEPVTWVLYPEEQGPHIKKYEDPRASNNTWYSGKNVFYLRLADIILCYAECLNELGNTTEAVNQVNIVRKRAFGGILPSDKTWDINMSQENFRINILDERMRELCFENWRRMDLLRTGKFLEYVKERNHWAKAEGKIQEYHKLYPIPDTEIKNNEDITPEDQNPGYIN